MIYLPAMLIGAFLGVALSLLAGLPVGADVVVALLLAVLFGLVVWGGR